MDNNDCCLGKLLKVIDTLQKNVNNECPIDEGCSRPYLGTFTSSLCYNTRPVTLYLKNGDLFSAPYNSTGTTSSVFRVEKVKDCCAKLRVLEPVVNEGVTTYNATNFFVDVNLQCICAIKCLADIILENI